MIENYLRAGFRLLPIHTPTPTGCSCGREGCVAVGKHPKTRNGVKDASNSVVDITHWQQEGSNIAVACGHPLQGGGYLCVLDIDPRSGGDEELARLEEEHGPLPETFRQITGGGGYHYFFRSPNPVGCAVLGPGVDLKGEGGYVLLSPSLHKSGKPYEHDLGGASFGEFAEAPSWINAPTSKARPEFIEDDPVSTFLGRVCEKMGWLGEFLGNGKRALQCPWGHLHTDQSWHSRASGTVLLPATKNGDTFGGFKCMHEHCRHKGPQDVIAAASEDARLYARSFFPIKLVEEAEVSPETVAAFRKLDHTQLSGRFQGDEYRIDPIEANAAKILQHDVWADILAWDEMTGEILLKDKPPFDTPWGYVYPRHFCDEDLRAALFWLQSGVYSAKWSQECVHRAMEMVAQQHRVNALTEYLSALRWDGHPRLDDWLSMGLGVQPTVYTQSVGPMWMMSAVARAYEPGCQVDYVLVIEGPQGLGKSRALKILGGEFFSDDLGDISTKDAAERIRGKWIVEDSEMAALRKVSAGASKSFITRREDRFRPAYGRVAINSKRRCVFAATINDPVYLEDPTGNRRYWSVAATFVDTQWLEENRDQLWAEAKHRYQLGESWYPTSASFPTLARAEQERRMVDDPWEATLSPYLGVPEVDLDILYAAIQVPSPNRTKASEKRLTDILHRKGYKAVHVGNRKTWRKG